MSTRLTLKPLISSATIFLPLTCWFLTTDFFTAPKMLILLLLVLSLLISWTIRTITLRTLTLPRSPFTLPLILLILITSVHLYLVPEGRPEALAGNGALLLLLPTLSLLFSQLPLSHLHSYLERALITTSLSLSLFTLLQLTVLTHLPRSATPTGSLFTTLSLMLVGISLTFFSLKKTLAVFPVFSLTIQIIGIVATTALLLPGSPVTTSLLPLRASVSVASSALSHSPTSLFLGVGLANYSSYFATVKPLFLNATPLWDLVPAHATTELLTILTTAGVLGFGLFVTLLVLGSLLLWSRPTPLGVAWLILALSLVFTPGSLTLYFLFFLLLPTLTAQPTRSHPCSLPASLTIALLPPLLFSLLLPLLILPHVADYYLRRAQLAAGRFDSQATYTAQLRAVTLAPALTLPHLSYAETNLRLASALSQTPNLTTEEQKTVATLLQQAIRESKTAVGLRPHDSLPHLTLGRLYQQLILSTPDAARFAIDSYARAVSLDPGNPALHVAYGQLFVELAQFDRARSEFQTAIQLKPDYDLAYDSLSRLPPDVVK